MIKSKHSFLVTVAEDERLTDSVLAKVFATFPEVDISKRENFFEKIFPLFVEVSKEPEERESRIVISKEDPEKEIDEWLGKDLRIKSLRLKSVRGFPESSKPYGFDLIDKKGDPHSLIILGQNGSGKSSLFDSIEYSYCRSIGEAQLREFRVGQTDENRFKEFLEHNNNGIKNIYCEIETNTKDLVLNILEETIPDSVRKKINPETHFISDFDIYSNGQLSYEENTSRSFHNTIAESLGLSELLLFQKQLKSFVLYRRMTESRQIKELERSISTNNKIISNNEESINEKKRNLEKIKSSSKPVDKKDEENQIGNVLSELIGNELNLNIDSTLLSNKIDNFKRAYDEFSSRKVDARGVNELEFLSLGMDLIKEHDNCPFCNDSHLSVSDINEYVKSRIQSIQRKNESLQELNTSSRELVNYLTDFFRTIESFKNRVLAELNTIREVGELSELAQLENELLSNLSKLTTTDFFIEAENLENNPSYLKNKSDFLSVLIEKYAKDFIGLLRDLKKDIDSLIENRSIIISDLTNKYKQTNGKQSTANDASNQRSVIEYELNTLIEQTEQAKKNIEREEKELDQVKRKHDRFNNLQSEVDSYLTIFNALLNEEVDQAFHPIKLIVEEVLESYFNSEKRDIELKISKEIEEIDEETGEVLSEIITAQIIHKNSNLPPQSVDKYLNAFHYRLFNAMVGISIAIASRINTKINLPLVLDDVFYASDFENRVTIENFVQKIFKVFSTYTPDQPLQFIMFTHDQLIFESIMKASNDMNLDNIEFAKLFPPIEAKERDDFKEVIYKMPKSLPQQIMETSYS